MIDITAYFVGALTAWVSIYIGYKMGYHRSTNKKADIDIIPRKPPYDPIENPVSFGGKVEEDTPDIW